MRVYIESDTAVELANLVDELTGEVIEDAAVSARLYDPADPLTDLSAFTLADAGSGRYVGSIDHADAAALAEDRNLILDVTAERQGAKILKRIPVRAVYASAND